MPTSSNVASRIKFGYKDYLMLFISIYTNEDNMPRRTADLIQLNMRYVAGEGGGRDNCHSTMAGKIQPVIKGQVIEEILATDEYKEWRHCGAERGGYFPVIDFQKDSEVISLKSIDLSASSYQGNKGKTTILSYIRDLADRKLPLEGEYTRILDVRVLQGTLGNLSKDDMNDIIKAAEEAGIEFKIKEF